MRTYTHTYMYTYIRTHMHIYKQKINRSTQWACASCDVYAFFTVYILLSNAWEIAKISNVPHKRVWEVTNASTLTQTQATYKRKPMLTDAKVCTSSHKQKQKHKHTITNTNANANTKYKK